MTLFRQLQKRYSREDFFRVLWELSPRHDRAEDLLQTEIILKSVPAIHPRDYDTLGSVLAEKTRQFAKIVAELKRKKALERANKYYTAAIDDAVVAEIICNAVIFLRYSKRCKQVIREVGFIHYGLLFRPWGGCERDSCISPV